MKTLPLCKPSDDLQSFAIFNYVLCDGEGTWLGVSGVDDNSKVVVVQFCRKGRHGIKTKRESSIHSTTQEQLIDMGPLIDLACKNTPFLFMV